MVRRPRPAGLEPGSACLPAAAAVAGTAPARTHAAMAAPFRRRELEFKMILPWIDAFAFPCEVRPGSSPIRYMKGR